MNRLIIIGNGFDLAHGLETSYNHFIHDYLSRFYEKASNTRDFAHKDDLFSISRGDQPYRNLDLDSFRRNVLGNYAINGFEYAVEPFFQKLLKISSANWVDIENEYFRELKVKSGSAARLAELYKLNEEFQFIRNFLFGYLSSLSCDVDEENPAFMNMRDLMFGLVFRTTTPDLPPYPVDGNTCILNFNYTSTIDQYIKAWGDYSPVSQIKIHGCISESDSIIFGYGDEHDDEYMNLEKKNIKDYMVNMKSMHYSKTDKYHQLLHFIDTGEIESEKPSRTNEFEVLILGHSCGLSDRTLFNTIFEHPNCKKIHAAYHADPKDHFYKTIEIARHFKNKAEMRRKLQPLNKHLLIPQFNLQ